MKRKKLRKKKKLKQKNQKFLLQDPLKKKMLKIGVILI